MNDKTVKEKVKAKITMMVIILGLIIGFNAYYKGTTLVFPFDTLAFISIIVLLFGVKKDTGRASTPQERRKIYVALLGVVMGITLILGQFVPSPYVYGTDLMGIIMAYQMYRGYKAEEQN